jgi:hypothetical protein
MKEIFYSRRSWDCQNVEKKKNPLKSGSKTGEDFVNNNVICKEQAGGT